MRACMRACVRAGVRAGARTLAHLRVDEAATVHDELSWLIARGGERAHIDHLQQHMVRRVVAGDLREGSLRS